MQRYARSQRPRPAAQLVSGQTTEQFVASKSSRPPAGKGKAPKVSPARIAKFLADVGEFMAEGDWSKAEPGHYVALYVVLHHKVYGLKPAELDDGAQYFQAMRAAKAFYAGLEAHVRSFSKSIAPDDMVDFLRWTWAREEGRERWRRDNAKDGQRVGWRLQFGGAMLSDYRVDKLRRNGR